ncbi:hypothetical protein GF362_02575 [Candidatus Dojkabacteria bacterium]|nr:hypothetical protein [Candidatus Dojkabacteria bacterium]
MPRKKKTSKDVIDPAIFEDDKPIVPPLYSGTLSELNKEPLPPTSDSPQYLVPTQIKQKREETRGTLAMVFILGFFITLILGGLMVALAEDQLDNKVKNLQDVFLAISGILSGPLGFVVGYYFRRQEETEI